MGSSGRETGRPRERHILPYSLLKLLNFELCDCISKNLKIEWGRGQGRERKKETLEGNIREAEHPEK